MRFYRVRDLRKQLAADKLLGEDGLKSKDRLGLVALVDAGADLAEPRHIIYFLYATNEETAQAIGRAGEARGFTFEVESPDESHRKSWRVRCQAEAIVGAEYIRTNTAYFTTVAADHNATYDGWEAGLRGKNKPRFRRRRAFPTA